METPSKVLRVGLPMQSEAQRAGHSHPEAFCLMWYKCRLCGHMERYWNSRDGVTPFGTICPSCGDSSVIHVHWGEDKYAPTHKPHLGQRVWVSMTKERATKFAQRAIDRYTTKVDGAVIQPNIIDKLIEDFYKGGTAPDLCVWGYKEKDE